MLLSEITGMSGVERMKLENRRNGIFLALKNLTLLPRVKVEKDLKGDRIMIEHPQEYVPNFRLEWSPGKLHYRVYILVAGTEYEKVDAGYCICTISSGLVATMFCGLYSFLIRNRANNKSEAY